MVFFIGKLAYPASGISITTVRSLPFLVTMTTIHVPFIFSTSTIKLFTVWQCYGLQHYADIGTNWPTKWHPARIQSTRRYKYNNYDIHKHYSTAAAGLYSWLKRKPYHSNGSSQIACILSYALLCWLCWLSLHRLQLFLRSARDMDHTHRSTLSLIKIPPTPHPKMIEFDDYKAKNEFKSMNHEAPCSVFTAQTTVCNTLPQSACSFYHQKFISCSNVLVFMLESGPHRGPIIEQ